MHFAALNVGRLVLTRSEKRLAELLSITDLKPVILILIDIMGKFQRLRSSL